MNFVASLDELKLLNKWSDYVVNFTNRISSARLEDGEMKFLLNKFDKVEAELASVKEILYAK